jgi:hypothetical protein
MAKKKNESGFSVRDRRSFSDDGEPRPDTAPPQHDPPRPQAAHEQEPAGPAAATEGVGIAASTPAPGPSPERPVPPVDFNTFMLSLGSSALIHLGDIARPEDESTSKNLPMAKHSIDILSMLHAKTRGNLTGHEDKLLESLLHDLRLRYVAASKSSP